jgi:hypothetical protein
VPRHISDDEVLLPGGGHGRRFGQLPHASFMHTGALLKDGESGQSRVDIKMRCIQHE